MRRRKRERRKRRKRRKEKENLDFFEHIVKKWKA